ncbi:uncharacterized protein TNCV_1731161 [Trichonephila clavipes]|nr:uncharacterized protein TNCV_1731161 [Trichonephila clavipes]
MTGTLPPLLDSVVGGGTPRRRCLRVHMDPMLLCPGKGLVLPKKPNVDQIATNKLCPPYKRRFFFWQTLFAILPQQLVHKSINTSRGVISEPDLLSTLESEILEGFSDQSVIQVRRITIKKVATIIPTKHLILTFNIPKLPPTIKAGYLNCKIRPYIPNPLRCFKCQRFRHSQTACRGQLTCSRCASVGHASTDCSLEQKCVNCSLPHSSDSKLCPKWKIEKEIQTIKTNRNISYLEARKLIAPQLSQTYAQVTKPSIATSTTQTDENLTKIKCPPLQLIKPLSSVPKPNASPIPSVSISSSTFRQTSCLPHLQ